MWNKILWSPVEIEALKKHRDTMSMDQLTIYLGKSRNAVKRKLDELDGKKLPGKKNKKSRIGKRKDLNNTFFRSGWEANVARVFNYIKWEWIYEPRQFFFEGEKRGAVSYLPDFYLPGYDTYIEVKGYISSRDRGAIRKFKKHHPTEFAKLKAITGSSNTQASKFFQKMGIEVIFYMNELKRDYAEFIPEWE
jgi:hypothetical protein